MTAQPNSFSTPANGTYCWAVPLRILIATPKDRMAVRIIW
jgi:hypothetical protein